MHELQLTDSFIKQAEKLTNKNPRIKKPLIKVMEELMRDPHNPSLNLHKLIGKNNWSVRVTGDIRIILRWQKSILFCVQIGSHDEVY